MPADDTNGKCITGKGNQQLVTCTNMKSNLIEANNEKQPCVSHCRGCETPGLNDIN